MEEARQPHIDEFKATCRAEFAFLISDHGFIEVREPPRRYQNPFEVHYSKNGGRLIVEGLSYGFCAGIGVQSSAGERVSFHHLVPEEFWHTHRQGLGRGQLGDIRYWALCLRHYGGPLLDGDWSGHADLLERSQKWLEEKRAAEKAHNRQFQAQRAVDAATPFFMSGDYAQVIQLLAPHEESLPRAQRLKLRIATERSKA